MVDFKKEIDGFDPLGKESFESNYGISNVFEEASRRIVHNILKSYTGFYDVFSELIQNSLDAIEVKARKDKNYKPKLWINIDISNSLIKVVDNGIGMDIEEFKFCLRPSVSFKKDCELRGNKGVGATFLAYGFSFIKIQSKKSDDSIAAIMRQGRQWAEDSIGTIPRPTLSSVEFVSNELINEDSGTSFEIIIGQTPGERPRNLGWIGAHTAEQWYDVLRIKTPLGGIYLYMPNKPIIPEIYLEVKSAEGNVTKFNTSRAEYYYPHEIPNLKTESLTDIKHAMDNIAGDSSIIFTKLDAKYKRLDCIYEIWDKDSIMKEGSPFYTALNDDNKLLIERHSLILYGCFLRSAKLWTELNDDILKLRKGLKLIHGGLQIASDYMPQGDLSIIPLTSAIGYQANSHIIVHFTDGDPDMGRKTFQPELKELSETLSVRAVNVFKKYLLHMKPDTGANTITPERELHEWKKDQENYRERNPLSYNRNDRKIALVSKPQQEQDVIALFHELIGMGILKAFQFYSTSQNDRYDSLFFMDYKQEEDVLYDENSNRLGINRGYHLPYKTEPKVLEYKFAFDSIVSDFEKQEKFSKQIDFVVCWRVGESYKEKYYLQSLLIGDEGSSRQVYGSTHQAFTSGSQQPEFEVLILEDLLNWLISPADEEARQKSKASE